MVANPIFPANRVQLNGLSTVLEVTCCESKAAYEKVKATRASPAITEGAGDPYRRCSKDTLFEVMGGECKDLFASLVACNEKNEYNFATKCKSIRDALEKCAVKNKVGELGKNYSF
mmetsp:Transcript_108184/g.161846  ORF Transcript_108184/g.161846 Transcript_108184/m.161846 type:complete len:116 (+) Transcript_108184:116-463(+)|eukprot:CAMPEP_0117042088 /NCGR_PEP_ID=MMETSP0472-20121206/29339_1 /TAXON_ID=693140 ORGANISM="Tiarina fusus, Strain LIS" /NCGR_SAMPLE_ID=MMETSP0472 /ASSEMBLY_ACC=CAM_ASM_000603 /LENGTH=115 /DNA_ID=CAMNT_0004753249 /DNA_START=111 /DNA_END=458 /DNA_ORIENTATION=-